MPKTKRDEGIEDAKKRIKLYENELVQQEAAIKSHEQTIQAAESRIQLLKMCTLTAQQEVKDLKTQGQWIVVELDEDEEDTIVSMERYKTEYLAKAAVDEHFRTARNNNHFEVHQFVDKWLKDTD